MAPPRKYQLIDAIGQSILNGHSEIGEYRITFIEYSFTLYYNNVYKYSMDMSEFELSEIIDNFWLDING